MGSKLSILKNTFALSIPNVLNPGISFILVLVISRYLGVEGLGKYSLVLSYVGMFSTFASLGLADLVVREVARKPQDAHKYLFNAGLFGAISSAVSLVAMDAVVWAMGYEADVVQAAFISSFALALSTAVAYMEAIFRAVEKSEYVAITFVAENAVRVGVCVWLLLEGHGIVALFLAILGTRVFGFGLMSYLYVRAFGPPTGRYSPEVWRVFAREAPTFTSIAIFSTLHLTMDSIMLSKLKSIESVGIYSAADRLLSICKTIPVSFASALLPFFTRQFGSGRDQLRQLATSTMRYLLVATLPVVVGTVILADRIVPAVYGEKFASAGQILMLHIVSLIPFSAVYILAQILIATDNQRVDLAINVLAVAINFVLNLVLIPPYGAMGAVVATLTTIIVFNQLQYWFIKIRLFPLPFPEIALRVIAAAAAMGAVTYLLRPWNLLLNVVVSAVVYCLFVVAFKAVSPDEIRLVTGLIRDRKKRVAVADRDTSSDSCPEDE